MHQCKSAGSHLAHQSREKARYLQGWVLGFGGAIDKDGYVAGMITTDGPIPLNYDHGVLGKFAMKPFLAQGTVIASERLGDYRWVAPIWNNLRRVITYRENTQYDPKWGLFYWENAMQSGRTITWRSPMTRRTPGCQAANCDAETSVVFAG